MKLLTIFTLFTLMNFCNQNLIAIRYKKVKKEVIERHRAEIKELMMACASHNDLAKEAKKQGPEDEANSLLNEHLEIALDNLLSEKNSHFFIALDKKSKKIVGFSAGHNWDMILNEKFIAFSQKVLASNTLYKKYTEIYMPLHARYQLTDKDNNLKDKFYLDTITVSSDATIQKALIKKVFRMLGKRNYKAVISVFTSQQNEDLVQELNNNYPVIPLERFDMQTDYKPILQVISLDRDETVKEWFLNKKS